jgi:hypothetical protein
MVAGLPFFSFLFAFLVIYLVHFLIAQCTTGSHSLHDCPEDHIVEQFPHEVKIGDNLYLDERISTKKAN